MNDPLQSSMEEIARLTREGRLTEATTLIQRTLGGFPPAGSPGGRGGSGEAVEAPASASPSSSGPRATVQEQVLRRAPRPARRFRGTPQIPGRMPGPLPGAGFVKTGDFSTGADVSPQENFVDRSYSNNAGTRSYKLYVPGGYVGQEVPLVVMLHGCTQNPDDIAAGTRMNALAEEHTFLVAYPAQSAAANSSGCWNWFKASEQRRGLGEPSILAGITCEVLGEYRVDPDRVYIAGMSAGGAMAAILGASYPDLYAAVGVHSGLAPGAARDLSSAFSAMRGAGSLPNGSTNGGPASEETDRVAPAIVFHGDRDTTVHPKNSERLLAHYRLATGTTGNRDAADAPALPVTVHKGQVPGGYAYTQAVHRDAGGSVFAEQWTVHGLGHAWSGGGYPGSYVDQKGPDASAEMFRFFTEHSR